MKNLNQIQDLDQDQEIKSNIIKAMKTKNNRKVIINKAKIDKIIIKRDKCIQEIEMTEEIIIKTTI